MADRHLSSQFDADLVRLSSQLLAMGGIVEQQVTRAIALLLCFDPREFSAILENEKRVNLADRDIDEALARVIARRQPAARDLRLLMASSKCTGNLERAADEAHKLAKRAKRINEHIERQVFDFVEMLRAGQLASSSLHRALDAFARLDTDAAIQVVEDDYTIDEAFRTFATRIVPYMSENPRMIGVALDYVFVAKAIERIGDHAKNIAEFVVYVVGGTDIRHAATSVLNRYARQE